MKKVSCIIPFYNEGERLLKVVEAVSDIKEIDDIVCIDDGSDDESLALSIREKWPSVSVIRLSKNQGKSYAVKYALNHVKNDTLVLMDADLRTLKKAEIKNAVRVMLNQAAIDMIILRRVKAAWFVKMIRGDVLLSGERIVKKEDLLIILNSEVNGYQLELAINKYMQENNKNVVWMPWSATNTYKVKKRGFFQGLVKEIFMFTDILRYTGVHNFIRQFSDFAKEEVEIKVN